jgi:hypothetical protein
MSQKVAEIKSILQPDNLAGQIAYLWDRHNTDRRSWLEEKKELRNYIFATDTTKTTNAQLPWKNKTTVPKLCQIRDNLHANYLSALFPNDDWLKWEGHSQSDVVRAKRDAIEAYMKNKVRQSNLRTVIAELLYDYIDWGNVFYDVVFVNESTIDPETGEEIPGYVGPKALRISPLDIVFNPLVKFDDSYKITRYVKTLGDMRAELDSNPDLQYNVAVLNDIEGYRRTMAGYAQEDIDKAVGYSIDGFGTYSNYLQSNYVEILEFEGSINDSVTGQFYKNVIITIVDRCKVLRQVQMPSWLGKSTKGHGVWRHRPDNAYGMGPLDNLVGMQYRIDHLENLKADAMDLAVHPPLAVTGQVEDFTWAPNETIHMGENASIVELGKNLNGVIAASNEIDRLELKMEEMAGAPKNAMGIRTPGEKTAFEVQTLEMAASRIFQNKIQNFEINVLEPMLNRMLEIAKRNMDGSDLVRVIDDDIGVIDFISVTKADITASGLIRPIGARHFAAQATLVQNLLGYLNSAAAQDPSISVHISGKGIAKLIPEVLGLEKFNLYGDNIRILEQLETQRLSQTAQETLMVEQQTPIEPEEGM